MRSRPRLFFLFWVLGAPLLPVRATELLPNPGFEGTYAAGVAPSWAAASIDTRSLSVHEETAAGRTGKAQVIRVTKKLGGYAGLQQSFVTRVNGTTGLTRGSDYEAAVWVRSDRRDFPFSIGISDLTAWQPRTFESSHFLAGQSWQRVVFRFRASDLGTDSNGNPLNQNGSVYFYIRLWAEGQLVVDDASFRLLGPADHQTAPTGNLIHNSSFEAGTDGWQGWNTSPSAVADASAPHGSQVLALNANGLSNSRLQSWAFDLPWGPTYTVSLWMRAGSNTTVPVWVARAGTSYENAATAVAAQDFAVTTGWARYSFTFTPPPLPRGRAFLVIDPPNSGTVSIDGVQVEAGTSPTAYGPRSNIESALVIDRASAVYAPGESVTAQWIVANHGGATSLSARRLTRDAAGTEVPGSAQTWSQSLPTGRSTIPVTLPTGGRLGAFRGEIELAGSVVADNTFCVLPPAPPSGVDTRIGTHLDFTSSTLPKAAGASWTKSWYLNWSQQESAAGVWNYPFAGYYNSWKSAGLKTLAVLGGPPVYRQNQPANPRSWGWYPPADLTKAQDYARRMGQQFGDRVAAWELCNEPDVFLHNNGYANGPDAYAAEALAYATGLLEAVPAADILVGSATVDRSPEIWIGAALANERANAAGKKLRDLVTGVSFHNYDADPVVTKRLVADIRAKLAEVANSTGVSRLATLPIWDTEWAPISHPVSFRRVEPRALRGSSGSSALQNAAATAIGIICRAGEGLRGGFLYHSYGPNTIGCAGDGHDMLHEFDGRPRPVLAAQAAVASFLAGAENPERMQISRVWGYRFVRPDARTLHAFWTDQRESLPVDIASPGDGELFDLFGNKLSDVTAGQQITVPWEPVFLLGRALGLQVTHSGRAIAAGDLTPSTDDGTDFGATEAAAEEMAVERTFEVSNVGSSPMALTGGVVLSGAMASDWSVVSPLPSSLAPGQSAALTLRFRPAALGDRNAIVEIATAAGAFRFAVEGRGTPPVPLVSFSAAQVTASLASGSSAGERTIVLNNQGRGNLTWSAALPKYYYAEDSNGVGGPVYSWYAPAEGRGTLVNFRNSSDSANVSNSTDRDDYMSEVLDLGFEMPFFGQRFSRVRITSNGVLTFNTAIAFPSYTNSNLPSSSAPNQSVFVLWDDLYMVANTSQAYWFRPDADTFVISWHDIAYFSDRSARQTFQLVLRRDGTITAQYATVAKSPNFNGFCIGIQNSNSAAQAVHYSRTPTPPSNSLAVRFSPPPQAAPEGNLSPGSPASWAIIQGTTSGSLAGASSSDLNLRLDASNLAPGLTYRTMLTIETNDETHPVIRIPVSLSVLAPPPARIPSTGLVGYWLMDQIEAGSIRDASGAGRQLTAVGNSTLVASGKFASALRTDGSPPVGSGTGPASGARFNSPVLSAYTLSAWVYLEGEGGISSAPYPRVVEIPGMSVFLRRNSGEATYGGVGFNAAFSGATGDWRTESGIMNLNRWYHIAVTFDSAAPSTGPQFYVDGVARQTIQIAAPSGSPPLTTGPAWIGNRPDGQRPFLGRIDHVRVYNRRLIAGEISALASDVGHALEGTLRGDWLFTHFGSAADSSVASDDRDSDQDGISNLLEYALGRNPMQPDTIPYEWNADLNRLRLRFTRVADPSLRYEVQAGTSLNALSAIWQSEGAENGAGAVEVQDTEIIGTSRSRFLRLKVSVP